MNGSVYNVLPYILSEQQRKKLNAMQRQKLLCFPGVMWCMYTPRKWSKSPSWCADKFWIPISRWLVQPQLCLVQASCLYLLRPSWSFWTVINQKGFCPFFNGLVSICLQEEKPINKQFDSENLRWLWEIQQ